MTGGLEEAVEGKEPLEAVVKRTCESCRHVKQRAGNTWHDQRCRLYRAGTSFIMTWTATRNPKRCGADRVNWEPRSSEEELDVQATEKARILATGGPQAALLKHITGRGTG